MTETESAILRGGPHEGATTQVRVNQREVTMGSPTGPLYVRTSETDDDGVVVFRYSRPRTRLKNVGLAQILRGRWPGGPR